MTSYKAGSGGGHRVAWAIMSMACPAIHTWKLTIPKDHAKDAIKMYELQGFSERKLDSMHSEITSFCQLG